MKKLLKDFFSEAQGQVDVLEQNVLVLENDPHNKDAVDEIFRAAHTLKGGAATVQMFELSEFTHILEDVLDEIRSGSVQMSEGLVDTLLTSIDVIKSMLEERLNGGVFADDVEPLKNHLRSFIGGATPQPAKKAPTPGKKNAEPVSQAFNSGLTEYDILEMKQAAGSQPIYKVQVGFNESNPMNSVGGIQVFAVLKELVLY